MMSRAGLIIKQTVDTFVPLQIKKFMINDSRRRNTRVQILEQAQHWCCKWVLALIFSADRQTCCISNSRPKSLNTVWHYGASGFTQIQHFKRKFSCEFIYFTVTTPEKDIRLRYCSCIISEVMHIWSAKLWREAIRKTKSLLLKWSLVKLLCVLQREWLSCTFGFSMTTVEKYNFNLSKDQFESAGMGSGPRGSKHQSSCGVPFRLDLCFFWSFWPMTRYSFFRASFILFILASSSFSFCWRNSLCLAWCALWASFFL